MTTRNQFIADTAAKQLANWNADVEELINSAVELANALEAAGVAPWQDKDKGTK